MKTSLKCAATLVLVLQFGLVVRAGDRNLSNHEEPSVSGIYPHLAVYNKGRECGIGAAVVWQDRLWAVTYPPHKPRGSDDKLWEITPELKKKARPESIGGTHASRMIHEPTDQLIIGPYFIDEERDVRALSLDNVGGRWTSVTQHPGEPKDVFVYTMEEGLYRVNAENLEFTKLHTDTNFGGTDLIPGDHGKGAYSGHGKLIVANNGNGGALAEWDLSGEAGDPQNWNVIDRNKFTDVTSRGGIRGMPENDAPLWAIGWDRKSVLLQIRDAKSDSWRRVRLPKASYTYDADHGWYTEWPRIRDVGLKSGRYLMDMHGMFFAFPPDVSTEDVGGITPISRHLKMVVDYTRWNDQIVLACNDTSVMYNPLAGLSQSNFVFVREKDLRGYGSPAGFGGPLLSDDLSPEETSEPFLIQGFTERVLHLFHETKKDVTFKLQVDKNGKGEWKTWKKIEVPEKGYAYELLPSDLSAQWMRVVAEQNAKEVTAYFHLSSEPRSFERSVARGLAKADQEQPRTIGMVRPRSLDSGVEPMTLHAALDEINKEGKVVNRGYFEMEGDLKLKRKNNEESETWLRKNAKPEPVVKIDDASVVLTDPEGNRFRLPKNHPVYDSATPSGRPRAIREVVTERGLMNIHGTFYELPYVKNTEDVLKMKNFRRMKPISTHNRRIYDYCSWRGLLVMTGVRTDASVDNQHIVSSPDGRGAVWVGSVDDLWKFPTPQGVGGPWKETDVRAGEPSDPYLMYGYPNKHLALSHKMDEAVTFHVEVDLLGNNTWHRFKSFTVPPGETVKYSFPEGYSAHWVRVVSDQSTTATATFTYRAE